MTILKDRHVLFEKTNRKQVMLDIISGAIMKIDAMRYPEILFFFKNKKLIFEYDRRGEGMVCSYSDVWMPVNNDRRTDTEMRESINSIKDNSTKLLKIKCKHLRIFDDDSKVKIEKHFYPKRWLSFFRL